MAAKVRRRPSAHSCVWLGKLPTPKPANVVLANVVNPDQLVSPARMPRTATPARTEAKEKTAKTPARKKNCCQFHHSANALLTEDQPVPLAPKAPMDHQATKENPAEMDNLAATDQLAHPAHLVLLDSPAPREKPEKLAKLDRDRRDRPDPLDPPAKLVHPAPLAKLESPARMVLPELLVLPEMLVQLAAPARLALPAHPEKAAKSAHPAHATTAHRLVCPRAIKRRQRLFPFHAVLRLRHQQGRYPHGRKQQYSKNENQHRVQKIFPLSGNYRFFLLPSSNL